MVRNFLGCRPVSDLEPTLLQQMLNPISSPGDPLFYLHHAFIDKLWWDWQTADIGNRLYAIGGPTVRDPNRPAPIPEGMHSTLRKRAAKRRATEDHDSVSNDTAVTTLGHRLSLLGLLPDVTAEDVMDIGNEYLCYQYA
jgi:tyrosinase